MDESHGLIDWVGYPFSSIFFKNVTWPTVSPPIPTLPGRPSIEMKKKDIRVLQEPKREQELAGLRLPLTLPCSHYNSLHSSFFLFLFLFFGGLVLQVNTFKGLSKQVENISDLADGVILFEIMVEM